MSNIRIVCYSRTGRTLMTAGKLGELLGAEVEEVREKKDRDGRIGYIAGAKDAFLDRPAELTSTHSLEGVDVLVIGMPVWASSPPPAIRAYLRQMDIGERKVFAFCTHDGGGGGGAFRKLNDMLGGELVGTLELKKPHKDPQLDDRLREFAAAVQGAPGA